MRHWFKDHSMRGLLKNSSYLAVSQAVASIAGIFSVAFTGRSLGLTMFGMLVLATSYVQAVNGLLKFQSWQVIVRYGADVSSGRVEEFREATSFALALDLVSGFGGMVLAMIALPFVGAKFGIPRQYIPDALLFCTLLPTMAAAAPGGVLRCLNRFDLLSYQQTIEPISRVVLTGIAWAFHAPFEVFLFIWWVTSFVGDLFIWFIAGRELRRRGLLRGLRPVVSPRNLPGAWRFAIHVNLNTTLMAATGPITRLIVGSTFGAAGAALYRAALNIAEAIKKPADLVVKVYYPHIAAMDLTTKAPWRLMARVAILAGAFAVCAAILLAFAGKLILVAIFGKRFAAAYAPMMVLCISPVLGMLGFPMTPMFYALNRPQLPVRSRLIGTVLQFLLMAPLLRLWGLIGIAAASVIGDAVTSATMAAHLRLEHRRLRSAAATAC